MLPSNIYGDVRWVVVVLSFFIESVLGVYTGATINRTAPIHLGRQMSNGSMGRWRYDSIYKDKPLRVASDGMNAQSAVRISDRKLIHKTGQIVRAPGVTTTTAIPTALPNVDISAKKFVQWFDDTMAYALNSTYDYRFKLRYAPPPSAGSPWPMPQTYMPSNISHRVDPFSFSFQVIDNSCPILHTNFKRIKRNIVGNSEKPAGSYWSSKLTVSSLSVTVLKKCTKYPFLEMDESYDLVVKSSGAFIISNEVWGALRGMETFSQLVYQDNSGRYWINEAVVQDFPRFKHRGLLLDTSRHFLAKEVIIDNIEAMAQNKLNVFHWHIVDDQSFPYESKVFPSLTKLGAYDPETHVYSHEVIEEIIEEARVRGIRVIPEFDTPGHTFSWGYGQKHLLTPCYDYNGKPSGKYGPVNPTLKKNYRFLKTLFQEVLSVFKDKYIHLGGDEVPFECWLSNPFIQKFMKKNKVTDIRKVLNLYERELLNSVTEIGKSRKVGSGYIVWQEVFDNEVKLNPDTIVQVWNGDAYLVERVTNAGFKAIFSTCWYLDYINYGQDWDKYYRCEALSYKTLNETLFIGGEVCMWTEFVDNDGIMPRVWPRASAAAERLWSNQRVNDVHKASTRIEAQRCRMMRTGLKVGVLSGPGHCPSYGQKSVMGASRNRLFPNLSVEVPLQSSTSVVLLFVIIFVLGFVICLVAFPAHRRRFFSVFVHAISTAATRRKLIAVFVVFCGLWFIWWSMRLMWGYHSASETSSDATSAF